MRFFLRILYSLLLTTSILLLVLVYFAIDEKPAARIQWTLTQQDIQRAKKILDGEIGKKTSKLKTLELTEKDLNIAVNHLINKHLKSTSNIKLTDSGIDFVITINLPDELFSHYLNIKFNLSKQNESPLITGLTIGQISIPQDLSSLILAYLIQNPPLKQYYLLASQQIKNIQIDSSKLLITYQPGPETLTKARNLLTNPGDNEVLAIYQQKLLEVIAVHDRSWRLSLAELLKQLFQLAYERSSLVNAIEENRNVIFIVNSYVNNHDISNYSSQLLPPSPKQKLPVYLYKRIDMAKHFMGSAAITASGSGFLANMLGLDKEIRDSQDGGSGFSFIDLAADRAGMYFGDIATSSPENARKIQKAMSGIKDYTAFMPDVRDLPENIEIKELLKQYQSFDSETSQRVLKLIDDRIAASSVYNDI